MSITAKSKKWEILHSLWIGWTFTFGFFNWIAFLYTGFRARQRKWVLWGVFYSVPFILNLAFSGTNRYKGAFGDALVIIFLILALASFVHAFVIRKEYLLRLEALEQQRAYEDVSLKQRLAVQYGTGTLKKTPNPDLAPPTTNTVPADLRREEPATKPANKVSPSIPANARLEQSAPERVNLPSDKVKPVIPVQIWSGEEIEYRISSAYPFPLAFGFRSLMSIVDPRDLYREQLRVAENMLAFTGSVALSSLREQDRKVAAIDPREFWLTGISPGDWKEIVALCSRVFAEYESNSLASDLKKLNIRSEKKGFGADVAALIRAKNDFKHDRGPVVLEDLDSASKETQERLKRCMEALGFFTAHPIRQVEDYDVNRRGGGVILKCLRYTGDHPSFPREEVVFDRALPRGDLFLEPSQQDWVPLFPFMTSMTCSHCKARETYFIDSWDTRRGTARMKSFERGHTMLNKEVAEALLEWSDNVRPDVP